jgi:hypothetical protein
MHFAAREHRGELVANQFADAQLPLRSSDRLIAMMVTAHFLVAEFALVLPGRRRVLHLHISSANQVSLKCKA